MATRGRSRTTCPSLRITHIYAATSPMPTEATFFAMINSLCCQLLAAQLDWSHADRHASLRCTRPRAARHQRTRAPSVRICTRSGTESILGWVDQNEASLRGSHRRRLRSAISVCLLLRLWAPRCRASVAGDQGREGPPSTSYRHPYSPSMTYLIAALCRSSKITRPSGSA